MVYAVDHFDSVFNVLPQRYQVPKQKKLPIFLFMEL